MEVSLLGELEVFDHGARVVVPGARQRALLAMPALGRGAEVVGELEVLRREHPRREGLWALRMTCA